MQTTGRLSANSFDGDATPSSPDASSKSLLFKRVIAQAIKDAVYGGSVQKREVVVWLVSQDFPAICAAAGIDASEWKLRIAELFRTSEGLRMYYAQKHTALLLGEGYNTSAK